MHTIQLLLAFLVLSLSLGSSSAAKKSHKKGKPSLLKVRSAQHHRVHTRHHVRHAEHHTAENIHENKVRSHHHDQNHQDIMSGIFLKENSWSAPSPPSRVHSKAGKRTQPNAGASTPTNPASIDIGNVAVQSVSKTCNGVILDPSIVLTSATCVFANKNSPAYQDITVTFNGVTKPVAEVHGSPQWLETGQRNDNYAVLLLAQPMSSVSDTSAKLTWSPYALEDIGESFVAKPSPVSCTTASNKAKQTDSMRYLGNQIITQNCPNGGQVPPGGPVYRLVNGQAVVFGVNIASSCTSGSLDRKITGACAARLTKEAFQDICDTAEGWGIRLSECDSPLKKLLDPFSPILIRTQEAYDAVISTSVNLKGLMLVYFPFSSEKFQSLSNDIEKIQRHKVVYDKFLVALVDTEALYMDLPDAPFIEYRTPGATTFFPYNDWYSYEEFEKFVVEFSRVGAPPSGSLSFIQHLEHKEHHHLHQHKRAVVGQKRPLQPVQSSGIKVSRTHTVSCDDNAYVIMDVRVESCECKSGYMGSGTPGNCRSTLETVTANCQFAIETIDSDGSARITYQQLEQNAQAPGWCSTEKFVFGYLLDDVDSMDIAGEQLTPEDCIEYVKGEIVPDCDDPPPSTVHHSSIVRALGALHHAGNESATGNPHKRTVTAAAGGAAAPANYLQNFLGNQPPPATIHTESYYITQNWVPRAKNKFATFFDASRGIAEFTGYKLTYAQMGVLNSGKTKNRALLTSSWKFDSSKPLKPYSATKVQGKNSLYKGRGNKKYPDSVDKGHLNPSHINAYDLNTMKLTHIHTNAYPQFTSFNIGAWKKFEGKIYNYAKTQCYGKGATANLYLVTGLSDYHIVGGRKMAVLKPELFWPVAKVPAGVKVKPVPQPVGSAALSSRTHSIVQAHSMWTVGCCTWTSGPTTNAQSISVWGNNLVGMTTTIQPKLSTLAKKIYPAKAGFEFFPGEAKCNQDANHFNMP